MISHEEDPRGPSATSTPQAAHETPPALALTGIDAGYGITSVIRDLNLEVPPGTVAALLGPNGAGKTTTLRVASGLLTPSSGSVGLFGEDVTSWPPYRRTTAGLALVPEGRGIFRSLTVSDNIYMGVPRRGRAAGVARVLSVFPELERLTTRVAGTLSGGEQTMLALARAYLQEPKLILLDEVSMGLAPKIVDVIYTRIHELAAGGAAVLLVEQYVHRALEVAETAHVLVNGTLTYSGPASALSREQVLAEYLGSATG
jgi:branched-chain amino acid transport system ATP-binding protein